jgi:flagellin-specific chaperone FliS
MQDQYTNQVKYVGNLSGESINVLILSKMIEHLNKIKTLKSKKDLESRSYHVERAIKIIIFLSSSVNSDSNKEESEIILSFYFSLMAMMLDFVKEKDFTIIDGMIKIVSSFKEAWEFRARGGGASEVPANDQESETGFKISL